jgi:hypothetical protein
MYNSPLYGVYFSPFRPFSIPQGSIPPDIITPMIAITLGYLVWKDAKASLQSLNPDSSQRDRVHQLKVSLQLSVLKVLLTWPVLVHRTIKQHLRAPKAAVIVPTVMVLGCVPLGFFAMYLVIGFIFCNYAVIIYLSEMNRLINQ